MILSYINRARKDVVAVRQLNFYHYSPNFAFIAGALCGSAWTSSTGIGSGQFLIQSFGDAYSTGKIALLVAGYEASDTVNAATYLKNQAVSTDAGMKYVGTSSTSATLQVS